jgi:hypothetical protein
MSQLRSRCMLLCSCGSTNKRYSWCCSMHVQLHSRCGVLTVSHSTVLLLLFGPCRCGSCSHPGQVGSCLPAGAAV